MLLKTIKERILLRFVLPSFVWFGLIVQPDPNNVAWFLMKDLLRLNLYLVDNVNQINGKFENNI